MRHRRRRIVPVHQKVQGTLALPTPAFAESFAVASFDVHPPAVNALWSVKPLELHSTSDCFPADIQMTIVNASRFPMPLKARHSQTARFEPPGRR